MSKKRLEELLELFNEKAPIARHLGMRLSYTDDNNGVIDLPYNPNLDHALGGIHGGIYATIIDCAGWFTAAAAHEESCWLATSEMSIHFLSPVQNTHLRGVGRIIKRGKRLDVVEVHLYDEEEHLVGHATGTFVVLQNIPL